MNSYQRRLQDIAYLKERVAQLESYLHPGMVKTLRNQFLNDKINKRRSAAIAKFIDPEIPVLSINVDNWTVSTELKPCHSAEA